MASNFGRFLKMRTIGVIVAVIFALACDGRFAAMAPSLIPEPEKGSVCAESW